MYLKKRLVALILMNTACALWVIGWWFISPSPAFKASVPAWTLLIPLVIAVSSNLMLGYQNKENDQSKEG